MPEYLAPGVYIEETSFRSRSIEGVPTSTTGFAGATRFGPVKYPNGPTTSEPRLITSYTEFERVYGGLERMPTAVGLRESYVAHAARAFFLNGGQRLYVSRVFTPDQGDGVATQPNPPAFQQGGTIAWRARWPGSAGNVRVTVQPVRRGNSATTDQAGTVRASGVLDGAVVEIIDPAPDQPTADDAPLAEATLAVVRRTVDNTGARVQTFVNAQGGTLTPGGNASIREVVLRVSVESAARTDVYDDLAASPSPEQRRWIGRVMELDDPEDEDAIVHLDLGQAPANEQQVVELALRLTENGPVALTGGNDGAEPSADDLLGKPGDPDNALDKATGLEALGEIEDIAIVALPDSGTLSNPDQSKVAVDHLIGHAAQSQYRIAVVDAPRNSSLNDVRAFRGQFDTKYGALYHPWVEIFDPLDRPALGAPPRRILLPPCGFVTGIYARNDVTRGVYKAPANEVVRGLTRFEMNINKGRNDVLNPEGINALRFFEGRGNRVWGARTMSSDPEWKYVNVRRFFIYLERSIDLAMQWAVFEPNNERLWTNIRQTVEDFLYVEWTNGALLGSTPEEAYFVRCDRTTMTQNDLDNGRLICLIGVAPTKPAEFVIFRIGQWTADARN